jgi:putative ABC transport system permease protein
MIRPGIKRFFRLPSRHPESATQDLDDEIRLHLEMRAEQLQRRGMSAEEAWAEARRRFGPVDEARQALRTASRRRDHRLRLRELMGTVAQDVCFGARQLRRSPGFALMAVLTLALGIGANSAIFSVLDGVLLRPAPFPDIDRLVMVWETDRNSGTTREPASVPDYLDLRSAARPLSNIAAFAGTEVTFTPGLGEPVRLATLEASSGFLPLLGVAPLLGRSFTTEEDLPGGPAVVMIGEGLWEARFARDPAVLGKAIRINDRPHTIVGVVPEAADFGVQQILSSAAYGQGFAARGDRARVEVWTPLQADPEALPRHTHPIFVLGRLAPGTDVAAAQSELTRFAADLEATYPENAGRGIFVEPVSTVVFGRVRPLLTILLAAVALVLLIACANVANLLLARGAARRQEVAVRLALGAGRRRLARQFLTETLLLSGIAAGLGLVIAWAGLRLLLHLAPADIARISEVQINARTVLVTIMVSVLVGVIFGMIPLLQARGDNPQQMGRDGGSRGSSSGVERRRFRSGLIVTEVALSVLLLVGAGLLAKSMWRILQVDLGFRVEQVLKTEYQLPASRYPEDRAVWPNWPAHLNFTRELLGRAAALPGVQGVALAGAHPLNAGFTNSFEVVGREAEADDWPEIAARQVSSGYFATLGLPLLRGRGLLDSDDAAAPRVVLINQAAAERFFPRQDPLGQQISMWGTRWRIVGVVAGERFHGLTESPPAAVYQSVLQVPVSGGTLLVRTPGAPQKLAAAVRAVIREVDPGLAPFGVETLAQTRSRSVGTQRFAMVMFVIFAAVALALASIGVYGLLSYAVVQRSREIGIRMALGASRWQVVHMILRQGMILSVAGTLAGLAGALVLSHVLSSLLYGVRSTDAGIFVGAAGVLLIIAGLASYLPGLGATRVDPMVSLRAE